MSADAVLSEASGERRFLRKGRLMKALKKLVYSAIFLALALILPFLTGQIPEIGAMLCPMHIPVLLCGFICGAPWGAAVGFIAPLLRFVLFGMPPVFPTGLAMAFELAAYGFFSGLFCRIFPKKVPFLYASLALSMVIGRLIWGAAQVVLCGITQKAFGLAEFWAGAVASAVPGILVQVILIPVLVLALRRAKLTLND